MPDQDDPNTPPKKKRKGPGRPRRAGRAASDTRITIRSTASEERAWSRRAGTLGFSTISAWLRYVANQDAGVDSVEKPT